MRRNPIIIVTREDQRSYYGNFALPDEEIVILSFGEALCSLPRRAADLLMFDCDGSAVARIFCPGTSCYGYQKGVFPTILSLIAASRPG